MNSEFQIARILKPRGLKGEVKVEFYSSDVSRFLKLKRLILSGTERCVEHISSDGGEYGFIKLAGVNSAEEAEKLRGEYLYAKREDLPPLPDGRHYIADLIGLKVMSDGECIGTLSDILQYGSADVYVVKGADSSLSFPAINGLIKNVDLENGEIFVDGTLLSRVVVYNR